MTAPAVTVVGAGLAGCEVALGLAERGIPVVLLEQKPLARTPAQTTDGLCELVCSNSFRGAALANAVGLLKEEMRRLGSFVVRAAEKTRVPAGGALAVDRERFSALMTEWVRAEPLIELRSAVVDCIPDERPVVIATGPRPAIRSPACSTSGSAMTTSSAFARFASRCSSRTVISGPTPAGSPGRTATRGTLDSDTPSHSALMLAALMSAP